jgi:hypothetical protein
MRVLTITLLLAHLAFNGLAAETNVFLEAGIPTADREWRGTDYRLAAATFAATKLPLPRFSDKHGKAVLARLTSLENFSFHRNRTLPIDARLSDYINLLDGANAVLKRYLATAGKSQEFHKEIAALMSFMLQAAALGVELADEFVPTIPRDENYAVRMDGLKKMNSGLVTIYVGAENSLAEQRFYSAEDLSLLLKAMSETLPRVNRVFSADYRVELRKKLTSHKSSFKKKEDLRYIDEMLKELSRSQAPP